MKRKGYLEKKTSKMQIVFLLAFRWRVRVVSVCPHSHTSRLVPKKSAKGLSQYKIVKCTRVHLHISEIFVPNFHNSTTLMT